MTGDSEVHVASAIVHVEPGRLAEVAVRMAALPDVEPHAAGTGRIVVTLEGPTADAIAARLADMGRLPGVVGASLVFHAATETDPAGEQP